MHSCMHNMCMCMTFLTHLHINTHATHTPSLSLLPPPSTYTCPAQAACMMAWGGHVLHAPAYTPAAVKCVRAGVHACVLMNACGIVYEVALQRFRCFHASPWK